MRRSRAGQLARIACDDSRSPELDEDNLRQASTKVRRAAGEAKLRTASSQRRFSTASDILGNSVIPVPPAAICAKVERLVARKFDSRAPALAHSASA